MREQAAVVLPGLGRADEIGEIAQAVETFKINAEQKARDEVEASIRQDKAVAQRRKAGREVSRRLRQRPHERPPTGRRHARHAARFQ